MFIIGIRKKQFLLDYWAKNEKVNFKYKIGLAL